MRSLLGLLELRTKHPQTVASREPQLSNEPRDRRV